MMEMVEGIMVLWDGANLFVKSTKKQIEVPKKFNFPPIPFDGQLS
jgi:hypothetical protein